MGNKQTFDRVGSHPEGEPDRGPRTLYPVTIVTYNLRKGVVRRLPPVAGTELYREVGTELVEIHELSHREELVYLCRGQLIYPETDNLEGWTSALNRGERLSRDFSDERLVPSIPPESKEVLIAVSVEALRRSLSPQSEPNCETESKEEVIIKNLEDRLFLSITEGRGRRWVVEIPRPLKSKERKREPGPWNYSRQAETRILAVRRELIRRKNNGSLRLSDDLYRRAREYLSRAIENLHTKREYD